MFDTELTSLAPLISSSAENLMQYLAVPTDEMTYPLIVQKIEDSLIKKLMKMNRLEDLD